MNRLIDNGYATQTTGELRERIWYLPHFGVTNDSKPEKLRLVFDAAAKSSGVSLNDQLEPGPDLLQALYGVLIRFRQYAVVVKVDIRDMFMPVGVREQDCGALRFLWREKDRKSYPVTYEMTRLVFGANSSPCSALYVKDENAKTFAKSKPDAAESVIKNSHVDDFLASRPTISETKRLVRDVIEINSQANFVMHGWASNRPCALDEVETSARLHDHKRMRLCDRDNERVLGLYWDIDADTLGINVGLARIPGELMNGVRKPTKREFLRIIMSIFDPLGLISPFIIKSKIIMQEVWLSKVNWDEPLRDEEHARWISWLQSLRDIEEIRIPRCITPKVNYLGSAQLHAFCDASLKAYTAAVYVRFAIQDLSAHVALIMAKSRVAPVKSMFIPRLELQAALLAARLICAVAKELEIPCGKWHLWSDSQTILRWLKTEPHTRQTFVAHRLGEINELVPSATWRWVPSKMNPTDCATRGICEGEKIKQMWFEGPDFLKLTETQWPAPKELTYTEKQSIDGLEERNVSICTVNPAREYLPLVERLFGWRGLIISARRVRKYSDRWRKISRGEDDLTVLRQAEDYIIRVLQKESFSDEVKALRDRST